MTIGSSSADEKAIRAFVIPLISLSLLIPLDVAMARRVLRDYTTNSNSTGEETLNHLHTDPLNYLKRARHPYLDTYKHKADSDLVLDGWRSLDDLKNDVIAVLNQAIK